MQLLVVGAGVDFDVNVDVDVDVDVGVAVVVVIPECIFEMSWSGMGGQSRYVPSGLVHPRIAQPARCPAQDYKCMLMDSAFECAIV